MNLGEIKTKDLLRELSQRELSKTDEILIYYKNGKSLKDVKKEFGSYGIETIILNLNAYGVSIPKELWELFLS